jgi:hypothetical protein
VRGFAYSYYGRLVDTHNPPTFTPAQPPCRRQGRRGRENWPPSSVSAIRPGSPARWILYQKHRAQRNSSPDPTDPRAEPLALTPSHRQGRSMQPFITKPSETTNHTHGIRGPGNSTAKKAEVSTCSASPTPLSTTHHNRTLRSHTETTNLDMAQEEARQPLTL